jgi:hypothetical protein
MRKLIWTGLLALPLLALSQQPASAHGLNFNTGCVNLQGGFRIKFCAAGFLNTFCEQFPCCFQQCGPCPTGGCGSGGGYGYGGCPGNDCSGVAPGPWYTYWPTAANPYVMTSPVDTPGWTYASNFQTPAPLYPYWAPVAYVNVPSVPNPNAGFQPTSFAPSYWYGR